jgi:CheY-like chemotaxis protein
LAQAGYAAEVAATGGNALERLKSTRFDFFVCDATLPDQEGAAVIRQLRTSVREPPVVLLLSATIGREASERAARDGADDYVAKPCRAPELLETIARALKQRASSAALSHQSGSSKSANGTSPVTRVTTEAPPIQTTTAWADLLKTVGDILGRSTGLAFSYEQPGTRESGSIISAAAFMVDVTRLTEVACGLFVNKTSGLEIARAIHKRDVKEGDVRELLGELGNNILGNLKAGLRREGFLFTIGLGQPVGMPTASGFRRSFSVSSIIGFSGGGAYVKVIVGARSALRVSVPGRKLREDMVVAADLMDDAGSLLVSAGTRLTASTIQRLSPLLPRGMVQVCTPATKW